MLHGKFLLGALFLNSFKFLLGALSLFTLHKERSTAVAVRAEQGVQQGGPWCLLCDQQHLNLKGSTSQELHFVLGEWEWGR